MALNEGCTHRAVTLGGGPQAITTAWASAMPFWDAPRWLSRYALFVTAPYDTEHP